MIVNKSMFPVQTGFGVISKMQDRFASLQVQLGTGQKAANLGEMGRDLPMSLSVRSRLDKIESYSGNIDTVNLRLSFLDNALTRFDKIETEARNSALQGQYGTNNINMTTLPSLSKARLDEVVTMLNSDVAGRYLYGGSNTDTAPLPSTDVLLDGQGLQAGYRTVLAERQAADTGDGLGRLGIANAAPSPTVSLTEDGVHPFGFKLSGIVATPASAAITGGTVGASAAVTPPAVQTGNTASVTFAAQPTAGQALVLGLTLPDGTQTSVTLTAINAADGPASAGQFVIGADESETAANYAAALDTKLRSVANGTLQAASAFEASENFFNGAGEPVLRVSGDPATSQGLRVATATDTVQWYSGQTPAVAAEGLGRLGITQATDTVTLAEKAPSSAAYGFQISAATATTATAGDIVTTNTATNPSSTSVQFVNNPVPGDKVSLTLTEPNGTVRTVELTAVNGRPGAGQFSIGADATATATNFSKALELSVTDAAIAAEGNPRQSVTAQVDDGTRVNYGIEANESGLLRLVRSMAALAVTTYPNGDSIETRAKFDGMAERQQSQMSESRNAERGSIEVLSMELAVAQGTLDSATTRHTNYKAQLENLLSDVETVSKEDVAMEILALQTRLQASYQVTSMVSQLSLVNFI